MELFMPGFSLILKHSNRNVFIFICFAVFNVFCSIFSEIEHRHHSIRIHVCSGACRVGQPRVLGSHVLPGRSAADPTTVPPSV